jgi:hypothetical protein
MMGGTPCTITPCSAAISKVTPLAVCVSPGVSGICGLDGFSGVTGLTGPDASSPIISSSSLRWNKSTFLVISEALILWCYSLVLKLVASLVTLDAVVEDAI